MTPCHDSEPSTDRVTSLVYDGAGNVVKQAAHHPVNGTDEARQVTVYTYGVTKGAGAGDSRLHHNGLLFEVAYPDSADADDVVRYAWNRLGETRWLRDQNGSTHTYTRDELGRVTLDKGVKPGMGPGAAIDDVFDAISIAYDDFGRVSTVRTLLKSNGSPANGVKFEYTKLWQVEKVWQDVDGASFGGGTPVVEYLYDTAPITNRNFTRMTRQSWPLGQWYEIAYIGTANGHISRPDGLRPYPAGFPSYREVAYSYVGLGMTAVVEYEPPDVLLDHHVSHNGVRASGSYPGFDRFGRVTKQHWVDGSFTTHGSLLTVPNIPPIVELDYAYDKASNRLKMLDGRPGAGQSNRDMVYEYDGLHRLGEAKRGVDGGSPAPGSEKWNLDMLGNWSKFFTDLNGDGDYLDTDEETRRSHNEVNELLDIDLDADTTPDLALTYDRVGNLRTREIPGGGKLHFVYDLWNRLVKIEIEEDEAMGQVGEYEYYGSHWRSVKRLDTDGDRILDEQREQYYSAGWQLIEERVDDDYQGSPGIDRHLQYLWGPRYIDDVIWHREDANGDGDFDDDGDHRWWHLTDAQFSTVAVVDDNANVAERVRYDAYGKARHHHRFDVDGDGDFDAADHTIVSAIALSVDNGIGEANYRAEADMNRDGVVDIVDLAFMGMGYEAALAPGELSNSTVKNTIGWNGYVFNPETAVIAGEGGMYLVRFRWYGVDLGRWTAKDPAGYMDGMNLYEYVRSTPIIGRDPLGLFQDPGWMRQRERRGIAPGNPAKERCCEPAKIKVVIDFEKDGELYRPSSTVAFDGIGRGIPWMLRELKLKIEKADKGCGACITHLTIAGHSGESGTANLGEHINVSLLRKITDGYDDLLENRMREEFGQLAGMLCHGATIHLIQCNVGKEWAEEFLRLLDGERRGLKIKYYVGKVWFAPFGTTFSFFQQRTVTKYSENRDKKSGCCDESLPAHRVVEQERSDGPHPRPRH